MTVYQKTMSEALEEVSYYLNESNLEKMRKAAKGAKQTLKMKDGSIGMDSFTASAIMQIYDKINDKNKKTFENMMKNGKKADIMKLAKFAMSKVNAEYVPEEFEEEFKLDEASYALYHKDFSSAMQHSYKMAKKMYGITVDPKEIDDKVASGPRKPSEGKTNKYRLKGDKGAIQVQVYNKGGSKPFELNMYKEEVELDEKVQFEAPTKDGNTFQVIDRDTKGMAGKQDKFKMQIVNKQGKVIKDLGSHASLNGAKGMAKNRGIIEEVELDEKLDKEDEPTVKKVVKMLKKASGAHAGQAKDLEKAVKEDNELDEGKMSQLHQMMKDGKSAEEIAKAMKLDLKTIKALTKEEVVLDEKIAGLVKKSKQTGVPYGILKKSYDRGIAAWRTGHRPGTTPQQWAFARVNSMLTGGKADPDLQPKARAAKKAKKASAKKEEFSVIDEKRHMDPADIDTSATDDDIKAADKNIMMQMRKAVSLRGQHPVEFMDKKKVKIPQKLAMAVIAKYNKQPKPMDKEKFQSKIAKSYKALLTTMKEQKEESLLDRLNRKILENSNG